MTIFYCVSKSDKKPLLAGRVPAVWGTISGLADVRGDALADLTWAGYPDHGFLTEEQALAHGVAKSDLDTALAAAAHKEGAVVRMERDRRIASCDWTQAEDSPVDKAVWAQYRQALRDITKQEGFPWTVDWPVAP